MMKFEKLFEEIINDDQEDATVESVTSLVMEELNEHIEELAENAELTTKIKDTLIEIFSSEVIEPETLNNLKLALQDEEINDEDADEETETDDTEEDTEDETDYGFDDEEEDNI